MILEILNMGSEALRKKLMEEVENENKTEKEPEGDDELEAGIKLEQEHKGMVNKLIDSVIEITGGELSKEQREELVDEAIEEIANAHIGEFKNYYTDENGLIAMEKKLKGSKPKKEKEEKGEKEENETEEKEEGKEKMSIADRMAKMRAMRGKNKKED